jgi:DNA repair exonuclease SbcCD ATPase subunit
MADLRLKNIEIRNWMTVKSSRIEFPEKGLVLVIGSNLAAEGKLQSVGAGKTALGEALARTLLGVTGRYTHLGYFLSDTEKRDMYVKVEAELLRKPLTVELGFKCKELAGEGEALRFTHGDHAPFQAARADQTRERLEKTLQVTPDLANWTAFIDGDRLKFNRMSQEDSVALLMTALAQPPWTEYHERATKKLQAANKQVAVSSQALTTANENFNSLQEDLDTAIVDHRDAVAEYQRQVNDLEQKIAGIKNTLGGERAAVKAAEEEMAKIKKQLKLLEDQRAAQNHQWEIERQTLRDQVAELDEVWMAASTVKTQWETQLDDAQENLDAMKKVPKNCPKCGKPWDKAHSEQELAKVEKKVAELQGELEKAEKTYDTHNEKRRVLNGKIFKIEQQMREDGQTEDVEALGGKYDKNERLVRNLNAMIHERELQVARLEKGVDESFVNKKLAVVEERTRALETGKVAIEVAVTDLAMDQEALRVVQYWYKAFSPTGIPNMILSDAIPLMNRVAQRISSLMTGGTLQITYSTTRELVSGESKAQLVTKVINKIGSKRLEGSSKGEGGLTNLIIAENLNEVGQVSNRIGFRWYDEVTSGQDAVVRRSIFAYLKEVAQRMGILIFAVDHHVEAASYADYVLVAEKSREYGTRYFWR